MDKKSPIPENYSAILARLKDDVRSSRSRAALAVNRELVGLYWRFGQAIVEQQKTAGWGRNVVERLANDLKDAFPDMRGFSPINLWAMRQFYLTWLEAGRALPTLLQELEALPKLPALPHNLPFLGDNQDGVAILSQLVRELPWGHNRLLIHKIKNHAVRLWYMQKAIIHGWSRNVLALQLESALHQRQGKAVTNFSVSLPSPDSDLAIQTLKDPYIFDFLGLGDEAKEREIERGMLEHLKRFFLELGDGFALVGQQYRLSVGEKDYYVDLLFYHIQLRRYIVVEVKAGAFEPAYIGQLNHYLSALDDTLRREGDNPTIGLLLCRDKDKIDVEYALRGMNQPMAIAEYRLTKAIPRELKDVLPSIEEIENELEDATG